MGSLKDRKASVKIQVVDTNGKPVANTKLSYNQTNHEFLFGYGAFDFLSYAMADTMDPKKVPEQVLRPQDLDPNWNPKKFFETRVNKWLEIFNYGTLPFYWGGFEKTEGNPNTEGLKKAAQIMKDHNVKVKGHPLCWHTGCAEWLLKYDNATILEKQLGRIQREVEGFKGLIDMWDVINEVVIMPVFDRYDNAITRLCKEHGQIGLVKKVFDQAYKYNPQGTFLINDFNMSEKYAELIQACLDAGVPITAIGLQSHQHQGYWGKDKIEEVLERYERFNLPIHFTENTIVSGPKVPPEITDLNDWHYEDGASTPELEEQQKNQLEEWYRTIFENHPLVKAITGWDFTDGMWLNAPSGILHKDGSEKPAFGMLKHLIKEEWHSQGEITTDANGYAVIEGFKGEYEIGNGKFVIADDAAEQKVTVSK
ncbi:MAG: endo-1,4-beta-xylanase [Treponema sp.]|nr:endo-1,4-beta-xylanase [Treponema sp.]